MHGKKASIKSSGLIVSNKFTPPLIGFFNLPKQVHNVVCLPEIVLDVVVLGRYAQFDELSLKRARLFKETMYFSVNLHCCFKAICTFQRMLANGGHLGLGG